MSTVLHLDLQDLKERAVRFFERPSFSMPVFVDESTLAILDDRSGVPQLSLMDVASGAVTSKTSYGERLLSLLSGSSGAIVFGMDQGGDERQQVWAMTSAGAEPRKVTDRPDAMHEPGALAADGRTVLAKSNARDESTFDIVEIDLETGAIEMWLEAAGTATPVAMSRDGQRALVIRGNTNLDADVLLIDRETKTARNLTAHDGEAWILGASFSPDERSVWYLTNEGSDFVRLESQDLESGERRTIREAENRDVEAFKISPNGRYVAVAINEGGWSRVTLHSLVDRRGPVEFGDLPKGTIDRFAWSPDSATLAFGFSTAEDPSAIVISDTNGRFRMISGEDATSRPTVVTPELIHFPTFDGRDIPAFLLKPEGEGPFPVLVEIHGGPESQRRLQYASAIPTDQLIQSLGIAVLSLNVRGSTGYGKAYSHLDDKELRLDAVKDVVAAVEWLRTRNDVIGDRIGVMGQSYGGFMTLASIALHPELWAVAVDVVGIANFVTFLERTGPWRRKNRSEEYGFLETDREMLERISPLTYIDNIRTPLFVIHGRNDPRVPLFEAEQIVAALEGRGQTVELRVFDDEGHGLSKRKNRVDGYAEAAQFLARHLLP
ncbi:MAG: LpqB family beta-propeller domain-containing protein [Chloroflexota bacterium]|nr:LpqB family beta-propeller domain-containing protein [Chloroflexota bacterium]